MKRRHLMASAGALAGIAAAPRAMADAPVTITLWHAMSGQLGDTLIGLIDGFNKSQSAAIVQPVFKGTYPQVLTSSIAAWRAGKAPDIAQIFDVGTADMLSAGRAVVDVWKLSEMTGVAIDPATYIPAVRGYYSLNDGKMGAMPFNSSTPMLWINQDAFEKAGLDPAKPPATWPELIAAARTIKAKNAAPIPVMTSWPTWVHFEQFAAIHNVEYATLNDGFGGPNPKLTINTAPFVKNLSTLLSMEKEGLFKYQGRDGAPSPVFYSGQAAMTFDSSGIRGQLISSAKFKFAAAYLPYHPSIIGTPINSIIGGASFWPMTAPDRSKAEFAAIAAFFRYMGAPAQDAAWSEATGYVPVSFKGYDLLKSNGFYDKNPGADLPIKQLTRGTITKYSKGIRLGGMPQVRVIIEEEWERAITNGTDAQTALNNAVQRGNAVIGNFAKTAKG